MLAAAVLALTALPAWAGPPWHADLAAARTAAATSHRPVLVIFTAGWSPESTAFEQQVLVAAEAEAVLAACFEPVRVDVDQRPGLAKRLEVAHVPSACVLGAQDAILVRFDCPPTTSAFVAAAARAAQDAAAAGKGSISLVTAKAQQLNDFATARSEGADAATPPPTAAVAEASVSDQPPSRFVSGAGSDLPSLPPAAPALPVAAPALPAAAPASWPAEAAGRGASFTNATTTPPANRAIEPASAATPWLSSPATAGAVPPPAEPEASAVVSDLPEKPKTSSTWSAFTTAFQKPFSIFSKPAKTVEPPTLAPARPTSPLAATTPTTVPTPAAPPIVPPPAATAAVTAPPAVPAASPDPYGSMPLGLEGYCPVTLADKGVWTEGRAQWGVRHRGRTYLFAGPEQQQAFLTTPDRYAPALSGDDPVAVVDQGKSLPGRRAFGVTYQSRMYLFSSAETRAQFAANPERYTAPVTLAERLPPVDATRRY
jgi:YHS domain-containing protein